MGVPGIRNRAYGEFVFLCYVTFFALHVVLVYVCLAKIYEDFFVMYLIC